MLPAAAAPTISPRLTVNFDFAWRYQDAVEPRFQQCTFEQGVNYGEGYIWTGATGSKEECCNACVNHDTCRAWDWDGRHCWVKDNSVAKKAEPGRWSGRLGSPWPANATIPTHAQPDFDDSGWAVVDAPHDYGRSRERTCQATGRRRRLESDESVDLTNNCSGWYRHHFALPSEWQKTGGVTWIYFEAVHHYSIMWLNGQRLGGRHINGYVPFWHRLDGHGVRFGAGDANRNTLAIFATSAPGSGMYGYHGGGLTRHQFLVHTSRVFLPPEEAWAHSSFTANSTIVATGDMPADGLNATGVDLVAKGTVANAAMELAHDVWITVDFIAGPSRLLIATEKVGPLTVPANGSSHFEVRIQPRGAVQLWSVARPLLHTAHITVRVGEAVTDASNVTFGVRDASFEANSGFFLNQRHTKLRGFCDFGTFGAMGAATPDRADLYRAQVLRAAGANAWRMAHQPPAPNRLDIMDRLGMLALDENHYYGEHGHPYNIYNPETSDQSLHDMADLVRRDRSHPSVFAWNLCNEVMCNDDQSTAAAMRNVTYSLDGTRPILMNHIENKALQYLDVQGMSHRTGATMDRFHATHPNVPIVSSEAASCKTERGVDTDYCPRPRIKTHDAHDWCLFNNEYASCIATALNSSDSRMINAGTFLWAGFDHGSGGGASGLLADWAGFEKPISQWIRSWWLSNISVKDAGRPAAWPAAIETSHTTVFILDSWTPPPAGSSNRSIHVYTNAPRVRMWRNGVEVGEEAVPFFGAARFLAIAFEPGNLTAEALDSSGTRLATHSALTSGSVARIRLSLDAPSPHTGTGSALVEDGADVALVRAELVDSAGRLISPRDPNTNATITFSVASGAARILGSISGSPFDQPLTNPDIDYTGPTSPSHYGMVRCFVQSTRRCIGTAAERALLASIHLDAGRGGSSQLDGAGCSESREDWIVLHARADGLTLPVATLRIPLTSDPAALPLAVAEAQGG